MGVARLLQRSHSYAPTVWFVSSYPTLEGDLETCRREHIDVLEPDAPLPARFPLYETVKLVRTLRAVHHRLKKLRPALVVLPADNRYDLAVYVRVAHEQNVPVAIVPGFMAATREWAAAMSVDPNYSLDKRRNRIAGWLYPQWVYEHEGKKMVAAPGVQLLARQWLGLTPPKPWTLHSGYADAIAMESAAMKRYCAREGLPEERLVLTGSIAHDQMAQRRADPRARAELCARLGIDPQKRILLTALPPDQLYGYGRRECDFTSYEDLVRFWIESISKITGWNTIVSLHPSVKRDSLKLDVPIADESTASLIPLCDLYVASVSSTIQWAIACGKPVINYDVYRYRYPDYLDVEGIVATEDKLDFVTAVHRITSDASYYAELATLQKKHAKDWGVLDGKAGERLLGLFYELTT